MPSTDRFTAPSAWGRYALISGGVALLHGAALWALQTGLVPTAAPTIVPAEVIAEFIAPPTPEVAPPPPAPPALPTPKSPPTPRPAATKAPAPRPTPAPLAVANAAPDAPQVAAAAPAPDPAPVSAPAAAPTAAPAAPAPPAPPRIELPSSNATHLNNPSPGYPAISKRLGEQGRVMLRVLIGADGLPQKVEVSQSSGYERLDRQAQEAVMRWRFVPGKRGGVPEAMWYAQPINFVLE